MAKSVIIAYILLFFGGFAGLHLIYLRRDKQAFLYWCTFGGYFGLGPLRDLYHLPFYVREANYDRQYVAQLTESIRKNKKPPFIVTRFVAKILIGNSWCYLLTAAVPVETIFGFNLHFLRYLGPLASALAVWLVGNIGRTKGSFNWCLIGAYSILPLTFSNFRSIHYSCLSSAIFYEWMGKEWKRTPLPKYGFCKRFWTLTFGWLLFCSLWASYMYFNAEIKHSDGGKIKFRDSIHNLLKSPMFLEFKANIWKLYEQIKINGFSETWANLIDLMDPLGELHALKVLGLEKGASQEEITARFKALTKEWHPDRHKKAEEKKVAQERFVEIAEAYEKLSSIKKRRGRINRRASR